MPEIVYLNAKNNLKKNSKVGLLATEATIKTGVYGHYFNKRKSYGHSLIVSPWGKILKDAKTDKNIIIQNIDKNEIKQARTKIPSLFVNKKYKID